MTKEQRYNFVLKNYVKGRNQTVWDIHYLLETIGNSLDVDFKIFNLLNVIDTNSMIPISFINNTEYGTTYFLYYYNKKMGTFDKIGLDSNFLEIYYKTIRDIKLEILLNEN